MPCIPIHGNEWMNEWMDSISYCRIPFVFGLVRSGGRDRNSDDAPIPCSCHSCWCRINIYVDGGTTFGIESGTQVAQSQHPDVSHVDCCSLPFVPFNNLHQKSATDHRWSGSVALPGLRLCWLFNAKKTETKRVSSTQYHAKVAQLNGGKQVTTKVNLV